MPEEPELKPAMSEYRDALAWAEAQVAASARRILQRVSRC
jgi:hypothetical protein